MSTQKTTCKSCSGQGHKMCNRCGGSGLASFSQRCPGCNGKCHITCSSCNGRGSS